jgi:uncharacterized ion transporter superfamily protein YfcC
MFVRLKHKTRLASKLSLPTTAAIAVQSAFSLVAVDAAIAAAAARANQPTFDPSALVLAKAFVAVGAARGRRRRAVLSIMIFTLVYGLFVEEYFYELKDGIV